MFVVSPIELTLKTSLTQAFVWAVRVESQEAAVGEMVTIYDKTAQPLGTCQTDAGGVCQVELFPTYETEEMYYAVIGQPGDADFSWQPCTGARE